MKRLLLILLCWLLVCYSYAEPAGNIYWVQFGSKKGTPYSIDHPEKYLSQQALERRERKHIQIDSTDLPVNPEFTDSLISLGFYIKHTSRWMNGAIAIYQDTIPVDSLRLPSFVSFIQLRKDVPLKSSSNKFDGVDSLTQQYYGNSTDQVTMLKGQLLHKYSKGEGVQIAVIDAGFLNANKLEVFDSLYARNGVMGTFDFVSPGNDVYTAHNHGTSVLSIMAGNQPGKMVGTAPNAMYWLLRSEDAPTESPVEEDYWIIAAEFADSVGCDVINTSLGYTTFDNSSFNHNYGELTGDSLRISKAANLAVKKGIVVVCSAGNEGNTPWKYICPPSEARDVLSVAAVNKMGEIASFSSRGFEDSTLTIKPDIAAMGSGTAIISSNGDYTFGSGTSFSSPVVAGMAACLVGLYPDSSAYSIIDMIRRAGNLFPIHNLDLGYGIPDFSKYLPKGSEDSTNASVAKLMNQLTVYPNPFEGFINVSSPSKIDKIELYSLDGHCVLSARRGNPVLYGIPSERVSQLSGGIYLARIWVGDSIKTIKLIKK